MLACVSGGPNWTGLTGFTGPVRYPVRFGPVRYFPQIPNRTFLMKCVPKWYLRLDFTFKSSKVAIFFGQISEISFQSHLIFIIQSFRNFEAGYIWKFICYEVRFGKVRFGSVKITGPVRFGKSGICLVRSTTASVTKNMTNLDRLYGEVRLLYREFPNRIFNSFYSFYSKHPLP